MISRWIWSRIQKGFSLWIRGPGGIVWWKKNRGSKIWWHCPFKDYYCPGSQSQTLITLFKTLRHMEMLQFINIVPWNFRNRESQKKEFLCRFGKKNWSRTFWLFSNHRSNLIPISLLSFCLCLLYNLYLVVLKVSPSSSNGGCDLRCSILTWKLLQFCNPNLASSKHFKTCIKNFN
jgi:hypothetical protein